ncbi:FAD-binding protein [Dehalococcoides mccartyi]|nr:FAD-binding protein [Dehalococcoides mccartyi]
MVASIDRKLNSSTRDLEADLQAAVEGEVRFDDLTKQMYSTDASLYRIEPIGVVIPRDESDVQAVLEIAGKNGVSVLPRGGGTGLSGQTVNHSVVLDFSKYMHNVREINQEERWVRTQPGVTIDDLNRQIKHTGLFFTSDPSTSSRANIGGAMGNNSCGAHSIIYGKTVDQVIGMNVVLSDGSTTVFEQLTQGMFESKLKLDTLEGKIYNQISDIARNAAAAVEERYPKILRRVGGYNLDLIQNNDALNLAKLTVGSEGTLVAVTEAKLNLEPIPKVKGLAVLHFTNIAAAMEATVAILEHNPAAVEHLGEMIISQARKSLGFARNLTFLEGDPTDILVVEMTGDSEAEVISKLDKLDERMKTGGRPYATTRLMKASQQAQVWAMRQAGLGLMMNIDGDAKPMPFVEDTAVSPEKLPEYVKRFDEIVQSNGTKAGYYGHASVGCLHVRPVVNMKTQVGIDQMARIADEVSDLVLEFGGSLSGEHGDGIVRGAFADKMFGTDLVQHFREVKSAFDPQRVMNPNKIFDTPALTDNLRYGTTYKPVSPPVRLDWSTEGGFIAAVEKCNGVGACRKVHAGAMCPSYMATREEKHTTRGRANALRAALTGALPTDQFASDDLMEVLDLCLECKSCKSECPSNVDMAKIKYEYLYQHYKTRKVPLSSKMVADIHRVNSLTAPLAPLANVINRSAPVRFLLEKTVGFDRNRPMPKVVRNTFQKWFDGHKSTAPTPRGKVVLFHDTFMNFNHPTIGISATRVLEALGYEVVVLKDRKCCGRPMISKGLLDQAGENARHNVDLLYPYVEQGVKIVGCEASCVSAMTDDWPDLLGGDAKAKQVAASVVTIEDILVETNGDDGQQVKWSDAKKEVKYFGHCHQRALTGTSNSITALNLPIGYEATEISAGCCGMAGSFGYEKSHIEVATAAGEDRLFPAIRDAGTNVEIATNGISCREQIGFNTPRESRHVVEILADALFD